MNSLAVPPPPAADAAFLRAFEALELPPAQFRHAEHLHAAWCCFRATADFAAGAVRFVQAFHRYLARLGAESKYHETITWFFLVLVHERLARSPAAGWEEFRAANPDLFAPGMPALRTRYRPQTLQDPRTQVVFVLPDALD